MYPWIVLAVGVLAGSYSCERQNSLPVVARLMPP
jgi:hypothetical protein